MVRSRKSSVSSCQSEDFTKLIVNYLPLSMNQTELYDMFRGIGPVKSCKLMIDRASGENLGYGFVTFCQQEDAARAIQIVAGLRYYNKTLKVSYARPRSQEYQNTNLYVREVPFHWTIADLQHLFEAHGEVISCSLLNYARTGENVLGQSVQRTSYNTVNQKTGSKTAGFVRFARHYDAMKAHTALNGLLVTDGDKRSGGNRLRVNFAWNAREARNKRLVEEGGVDYRLMQGKCQY